MTQIFDPC
nr:unnamed protein product [Callosobruchus analis]